MVPLKQQLIDSGTPAADDFESEIFVLLSSENESILWYA